MAMEREENRKVEFEIKAFLGVLTNRKDGWKKELNLVSWNGQNPPKFDIRDWSDDHTRMSRGITLFDNEMSKLTHLYTQFCNARVVSEGRNNRSAAAQAGLRAGSESNTTSETEGAYQEDAPLDSFAPVAENESDDVQTEEFAALSDAAQAGSESSAAEAPF